VPALDNKGTFPFCILSAMSPLCGHTWLY